MSLISDEILNKYLDGELDKQLTKQVETKLKSSEAERKNFQAFKLLHAELSALQEDRVKNNFTSLVMSKIQKKAVVSKDQKFFMLSISSIIVVICLAVVSYVAYMIISSYSSPSESFQVTETAREFSSGLITELTKMFSGKNLSIIGSVFALALLVSGYFFFERQKQSNANLGA